MWISCEIEIYSGVGYFLDHMLKCRKFFHFSHGAITQLGYQFRRLTMRIANIERLFTFPYHSTYHLMR